MVLTRMRVLVNRFVGYDADARHRRCKNMNLKLEDQLRGALRLKQFSCRAEEAHVQWYRRHVRWHGKAPSR